MAPYKGTKIVTYHRSWPNFMERFGLEVIGYVEPKPGIPPSPSHTVELIDEMKRQGVEADRRRAVLRPEDAAGDRESGRRQGAGAGAVGRRREGSRPTTSSCSTTTSSCWSSALKQTDRKVGRSGLERSLQFLAPAIAASLIIAGIHAYLGLHVVERGVIFVDLSLAQIASLGAAIAVWQGYDPHDPAIYWMSLGFTLIGALIFAMVKGHEAQHPAGSDHRHLVRGGLGGGDPGDEQGDRRGGASRDMLVGNILSVQWPEVWLTAAIYVVIGIFHCVFRKRFLEISIDPHGASARGISVRFWDFLFYASFGFVVTRSVAIAGVLLVFCYLIVPSVGGDAVLVAHRSAPGDRLGDGDGGVDARHVFLGAVRSADRRDDRLHLRRGADRHGRSASARRQEGRLVALSASL